MENKNFNPGDEITMGKLTLLVMERDNKQCDISHCEEYCDLHRELCREDSDNNFSIGKYIGECSPNRREDKKNIYFKVKEWMGEEEKSE